MVPCITAFDPSDPYLGRIDAKQVAPPHTALSLKRCLAKKECVENHASATLCLTILSRACEEDSHKIDLSKEFGPGANTSEPLALVANISTKEEAPFLLARQDAQAALMVQTLVDGGMKYRE